MSDWVTNYVRELRVLLQFLNAGHEVPSMAAELGRVW